MTDATLARQEKLHRRGLLLEWFSRLERGRGLRGDRRRPRRRSVSLVGFGVGLYAAFGWWWADPVGALAMLPVILWQGWETFEDAREKGEEG